MTEHKYTDEEVIKALECCAVDPKSGKFSDCKNCPLDAIKDANCFNWIIQQCALDLINRKKAEVAFWMDAAANAKKEAVKEFAEKLKKECLFDRGYEILQEGTIDHLAKELTEEKT